MPREIKHNLFDWHNIVTKDENDAVDKYVL